MVVRLPVRSYRHFMAGEMPPWFHGTPRRSSRPKPPAGRVFPSQIRRPEARSLTQDSDPRVLLADYDEAGLGGWQAWAEPALGAPWLWAASFAAGVPHDLVAAFAASLSSSAAMLQWHEVRRSRHGSPGRGPARGLPVAARGHSSAHTLGRCLTVAPPTVGPAGAVP